MNVNLTTNEIDDLCRQVVQKAEKVDIYSFIIFDTLYRTGLRISELLEINRIQLLSSEKILITTQKKSNNRIIDKKQFNEIFIESFISNQLHFLLRNYKYYSLNFNLYNPLNHNLRTRNKQISTHLFRHNYIKKRFQSGLSVSEISNEIGEKENKNTLKYINSIIYYQEP